MRNQSTSKITPSADVAIQLVNPKTLNANNATAHVPIFRISGSVLIKKLYGVVTTDLGTTHTFPYFRINDQTTQEDLTSAGAGPDISGYVAGSLLVKTGPGALGVSAFNAAAYGVGQSPPASFVLVEKVGANTDIEYNYSTTDTPTTGVIDFYVEYEPLSSGGQIFAV